MFKTCVMKTVFAFVLLLALSVNPLRTFSQSNFEFSSGYAVNRNLADGFPLHVGYDFQLHNRWYTKFQMGYKHLHYYNDHVGATINVSIWEFHETVAYEVVKKRTYIFKPNLGINYRFYNWSGEMKPPFNSLPIRAWVIEFRDRQFLRLVSTTDGFRDVYRVNNLGFSIQLQNQFRVSEKIWLHITPFIEPDYDRSQNTGGCYVGIILKPR